jgi:hypothetical protein
MNPNPWRPSPNRQASGRLTPYPEPPAPPLGEIARDDPMPPGPYSVGMTHGPRGDEWPYTIQCGDGRAIAGHIHSKACAEAIVLALNIVLP